MSHSQKIGPAPSDSAAARPTAVLTFDIEEWFQVENLRPVFPRVAWDGMSGRVGPSTRVVLDFLDSRQLRATFFILGWVAEREPELIKEIARRGHEVACHGHGHVLAPQLTRSEFRADVVKARKSLEDAIGEAVCGYRAPSFSADREHLTILAECGFRYDSSMHPFSLHGRYGRFDGLGAGLRPGVYRLPEGLVELALPVEKWGPVPIPIAGGGYFRLYPGSVFRRLVRRALERDGHYVMYLHSWEFDPDQPRVKVPGIGARFRHYNNLSKTLPRAARLVQMLGEIGTRFVTAREWVDECLAETAEVSAVASRRP